MRFLKYELLTAILPFWNVEMSQPLTSTFLPSGVVPVKVHSATEDRTVHFHEVHLDDGTRRRTHVLSRGYVGLYVPNMIWRELENFSTNAVCLILASEPYSEGDYLRDYAEFLQLQRDR